MPRFEEKLRAHLADRDKEWLIEQIVRLTLDAHSRGPLIQEGFLSARAPAKGSELIGDDLRSAQGNALLQHAKDILFGFLFGDETTNTRFQRTQRALLTQTVPRMKSDALDFMKATTELSAMGTWQDPKGAVHDLRADNVVLEIEYGEIAGGRIGDGVVTTLKLINNLEINEEILYGRMENIEHSTRVS